MEISLLDVYKEYAQAQREFTKSEEFKSAADDFKRLAMESRAQAAKVCLEISNGTTESSD